MTAKQADTEKQYRVLVDISHRVSGEVVKRGGVRPRSWWSHVTDFEFGVLVDDLKLIEEVNDGGN